MAKGPKSSSLASTLEAVASECRVSHLDIEDLYPCTALQEGLVAVSALHPGRYVLQRGFRLHGDLSVERLKSAWEQVAAFNPILRTRIVNTAAHGTLQVVIREGVQWADASSLGDYISRDRLAPTAYGSRLVRYAIIDDATEGLVFVWTIHHALFDGYSAGLILAQVKRAYEHGKCPPLQPFSRFVAYLASRDRNAAADFWRQQLSGDAPATWPQLPSPDYKPSPESNCTKMYRISLHHSEVTMATIMRAAWAILISRYACSDVVCFGAPSSGRSAPVKGITEIVGPTITTVPVKISIDPQQDLHEFLDLVQQQAIDMLPHEYLGLQHIRRVEGVSAEALAFQNLLVVQQNLESENASELRGMTSLSLEKVSQGLGAFDSHALVLECTIGVDTVELSLRHDQAVITEHQATRMIHHFERVAQQLVTASKGTIIASVDMRSSMDQEQILSWRPTSVSLENGSLPDGFRTHAQNTPNAPAICAWDGDWTYAQLDDLSSRLACHLQNYGVRPEVFVPLCFEKTAWAIVAMLAVLKAGGAYAHLDPNHPRQRLEYSTKQLNSNLLLAGSTHSTLLDGVVDHVMSIDESLLSSLLPADVSRLAPAVSSQAAFVVFTSGSTGLPKGVVLEHGAVYTSLCGQVQDLEVNSKTRILQFSSYSWDMHITEVFAALTFGGCICIPSQSDRLNNLAMRINDMNVNLAILTPTVASMLEPQQVSKLRDLVLIGEGPSQGLVETWTDGNVRLRNGYGPCEASMLACIRKQLSPGSPTNIGRGMWSHLWVVDSEDHNKLAPVGLVGELLIEGPGLARGYLNDNEKTAEAFIEDPSWICELGLSPGHRMYKTGDLVRYDENDGSLIYIGRKDSQVKVHGQRLELSEVDYALSSNKSLQSALALLPKRGLYKGQLVAILSPKSVKTAQSPKDDSIFSLNVTAQHREQLYIVRDSVSAWLPTYMVPTQWIMLESLPTNASGKIDRRRIQDWVEETTEAIDSGSFGGTSDTLDPPSSEMEHLLVVVWAQVLNKSVAQVGVNQPFTRLGGDSITAMQVQARCRGLQVAVLVEDVLKSKSVRQLAVTATRVERILPQHEIFDRPFPLSPIQRLFFDQIVSPNTAQKDVNKYTQSVALKLTRNNSTSEIAQAVTAVVGRHSMLRARFSRSNDNEWVQQVLGTASDSYAFESHQVENYERINEHIKVCYEALDIQRGPVFKAQLYQIGDGSNVLVLIAHHLVVDLVSWRILVSDMEAHLQGQSIPDTKPVAFQAWLEAQSEYCMASNTPRTLPSPESNLPNLDYWGMARGQNTYGATAEKTLSVETSVVERLFSRCNEVLGADPIDSLLSVLTVSFAEVFIDRKIPTFWLENHGREPWTKEINLSETVGWFTTLRSLTASEESRTKLLETLRCYKDTRKSVPANGWYDFTSRCLRASSVESMPWHHGLEVLVNYHGRYQQLERPDALFEIDRSSNLQSKGAVGPSLRRLALIEITIAVEGDHTNVSFVYHRDMHHQSRIKQWVALFADSLNAGAAHLAEQSFRYTPTDFPLMETTHADLKRAMDALIPQLSISQREAVEDMYPCSPMQQALLLSRMKSPDLYKISQICEVLPQAVDGRVSIARLLEAWKRVIRRHTTLRTVFQTLESASVGDEFAQVVLKEAAGEYKILESGSRDAVQMLKEASSAQFTAGRPPYCFTIAHSPSDRVFFKLEIDHTLIDGTSLSLLGHDLCQAYEDKLPQEPAMSYSDFIGYLQARKPREAIDYWKEYLSGVEACHLPTSSTGIQGEAQYTSVPVKMTSAGLFQFAARHGVTLANIFQVAWALVLQRFTGTDEVCFGYLASGRDVPVEGIEEAIGAFINMMVCRIGLNQNEIVTDVVRRAQNESLRGLKAQHCALYDLFHELNVGERGLFNTELSVQRAMGGASEQQRGSADGIKLAPLTSYDPTEYAIIINVSADDNDIVAAITYDTATISEQYASQITATLEQTLSSMVESEGSRLGGLNLLSGDDQQQILAWNSVEPVPVHTTIHELFVQRAAERPGASAVCSWDGDLTYAELDSLSLRMAQWLRDRGVGPEVMVPVCFNKSVANVVCMVAILRAGGVCISFNAAHPAGRLAEIISDVNPPIILVAPQYRALFAESAPVYPTTQDFLKALPEVEVLQPQPDVSSHNAALIVFTSGTTGRPKGVVLTHLSFCSMFAAESGAMQFGTESRVLNFASPSLDVNNVEVFGTLTTGGCVCVPSEDEKFNDLNGVIQRKRVNWLFLTPSLAQLLDHRALDSLRTLALGGEVVRQETVTAWADKLRLISSYGPSETGIWCALIVLQDGMPAKNMGMGLGSLMWLVEPTDINRLTPVGVVGEVLIEGPLLARGYLHDEAKTNAAFIYDPTWVRQLGRSTGRRFYKTGDLARYNPDGSMSFVARKDAQIKLHGQRVELGEIEHQISVAGLQKLDHAAVTAVANSAGEEAKVLAAFLCLLSEDDEQITNGQASSDSLILPITPTLRQQLTELRKKLSRVLPSYMVPSLYLPLRRMPTTANGKLDKSGLQKLCEALGAEQSATYSLATAADGEDKRVPSTTMEKQLQALWAQVLAIPEDGIGANDDFFQHGGDSVRAMRLVGAARKKGLNLTVANIFKDPKLSSVALAVKQPRQQESKQKTRPFEEKEGESQTPTPLNWEVSEPLLQEVSDIVAVRHNQIKAIYPSTALQEGLLASTNATPGSYILRMGYRISHDVDLDRFRDAWRHVWALNDILRTRFVHTQAAGTLQVVLDDGEDAIKWRTEPKSLGEYMQADKATPMEHGSPLVRFGIVSNAGQDRCPYFMWTMHHALYDGRSVQLLLSQVARAYQGLTVPQPLPFSHFMAYLLRTDTQAAARFWTDRLSSGGVPVSLPQFSHKAESPRGIRTLRAQVAVTGTQHSHIRMSVILQTAWAIVQSAFCNSNDIIFCTTSSGRASPVGGIEDIVGPTFATFPLRITLDPQERVADLLSRLQKQAAETIAFEHFGLQNIQRIPEIPAETLDLRNLFVVQPKLETKELEATNDGMGLERAPLEEDGAFHSYPLVLESFLRDGGVDFEAAYDETVLPETEMRNVMASLGHVVQRLAEASPDVPVGAIELVGEENRKQLMEWNSTTNTPGVHRCLHELVAQRIREHPSAPAICSWERNLSYGQLGDLSTKLAARLQREYNIGPEVKVPYCLDKSPWAPVVALAILMAGGVCVPLNAEHPDARLDVQLRTLKAPLFLVSPWYVNRFQGRVAHTLAVDSELFDETPTPQAAVSSNATPGNAAFIVYTSGSTGTPKGVVLEHSALCTSAQVYGDAFNMGPGTRVLQFAAYTFDVAISDFFYTLTRGACICVISEGERMDDLMGSIVRTEANYADLTSTVARLLDPVQIPTLKTLILAGEPLAPDVVSKFAGHANVINAYGPAECSVNAACRAGVVPEAEEILNYGCPVAAAFWVVNPMNHDQLYPLGAVGEVLIQGPLLARGYLENEAANAKAFIQDPAWAKQLGLPHGSRMYKTGDLARFNEDGTLTYFGRRDTQIKINGQRIELGEIEQQIREGGLGRLRGAAVDIITHDTTGEKKHLVSFLCIEQEGDTAANQSTDASDPTVVPLTESLAADLSSIRDHLFSVVPAYMVPGVYLPLTHMPQNINAKLDRLALRRIAGGLTVAQLAQYSLTQATKKLSPTNATEATLRALWAEVLGLGENEIGVDDNFFRLGGDSVSAMRLSAAARKVKLKVTVQGLLRHPVLRQLATQLQSGQAANGVAVGAPKYVAFSLIDRDTQRFLRNVAQRYPELSSKGVEDAYPVTDFQALAVTGALLQPQMMMAYHTFASAHEFSLDDFRTRCTRAMQRFSILRTVFVHLDHRYYQLVLAAPEPDIVLIYIHTDKDIDEEAAQLVRQAQQGGGSDETGAQLGRPFLQFTVVQSTSSTAHRIIVRLSHAQYDGFSLPQVWEALFSNTHERLAANGSAHTNPDADFASFVVHSQRHATSEAYQYWHKLLADSSAPLSLLGAVGSSSVSRIPRPLSSLQTFTAKLAYSAHKLQGATPATLVKAAWAVALGRTLRLSDIVFGEVVSCRSAFTSSEGDGENFNTPGGPSGPCVNIVPVRVCFDPGNRVDSGDLAHHRTQVLRQLEEQKIEGLQHETVGFRETMRQCKGGFSSIVQHRSAEEGTPPAVTGVDGLNGHATGPDTGGKIRTNGEVAGDASGYHMSSVSTPPNALVDVSLFSASTSVALDVTLTVPRGDGMEKLWNALVQTLTTWLGTESEHDRGKISSPEVKANGNGVREEPQPKRSAGKMVNGHEHVDQPSAEWPKTTNGSANKIKPEPGLEGNLNGNKDEAAEGALRRAWKGVLNLADDSSLGEETDSFSLGGDMVSAGLLELALRTEEGGGYAVRVEDLLQRPRFGAQMALLRNTRRVEH